MAVTYVVANQKGGIGKTTTATTLAGILGKKAKTLLIDADPQGNSTSTYQAKIEDSATLYDVMVDLDKLPIDEAIQHMPNGDIVASDPLLTKAEKMLDGDVEGLYRLKDAIDELDGYDYIVIDTAPSLNVILYNCLIAADSVVIPVTADAYSLQGMKQLHDITSYRMKVEYEDKVFEDEFIYGMITNSISVGGFKGMTGSDVKLDDGVFEVCLIKTPKNPIELNQILACLTNMINDSDLIYSFKTNEVHFEAEEKVAWTLDGEFGGEHEEVTVRNLNQRVRIFC